LRKSVKSLLLTRGFWGAVLGAAILLSPRSTSGQIEIDNLLEGFLKADFRPVYLKDSFLPIDPLRSHLPLGEIVLPTGNEHPRLLFSQRDRSLLQARIRRRPYSMWWNSLRDLAQTALSTDLTLADLREQERALYAEACAFSYFVMGDGRYLQKAKEALLNISPPPRVVDLEGGDPGEGWGDFVAASQAMLPYLVAYDIVAPELTSAEDRFIRQRLAGEAIQLYHYLPVATPNNHKTVMSAALGAAALCLSPHQDYEISPELWIDRAVDNLEVGLSEISKDGSYREGPYYATFIAQQTFPFFLFVKNCAGVNYFEDIRMRKFVRYLLDIQDSGGETVIFDDSHHSRYNSLPLASGNPRESARLNWGVVNDSFITHRRYNLVASIANFDDRIPAEKPPGTEINFYPDGGQAVFKRNGRNGGIHAILLGEPEREFSTGHEHYDPGSLLLNVDGGEFLVASGYGPEGTSSTNRDYYLLPESENVVLVNGRGPNRNPLSGDRSGSRLGDLFHTDRIASASVSSFYRGAELKRTFLLPNFKYVVLYDRASSPEPADFELLFHTPTECRFTEARSLVLETSTGKRLEMFSLGDLRNLKVTFGSGVFSHGADLEETSKLIKVSYLKREELYSPTVFMPEEMSITEVPLLENPDATAFIIQDPEVLLDRHIAVRCDSGSWQYEGIISNADFCLFDKNAAGVGLLYAFGCSELTHEKQFEFHSSERVDVFLQNQHRGWAGYITSGYDSVGVEIHLGFNPGRVIFADQVVPYDYEEGSINFDIMGSGYLNIGAVQPVWVPYEYRESPNVTQRLRHHPDPMWYYHHLTPEDQTWANEEIAKEVISAFNQRIDDWMEGEGFENPQAGRWATALAGFTGQFAHPNVGVVQELSGRWEVTGNEMEVLEEGLIKEERLYLRRLWMSCSLGESSSLRLRRNSLFEDHNSTYLDLSLLDRYGVFVERENFEEKKNYSFGGSFRGSFDLSLHTSVESPGPGRAHRLLFQSGGVKSRVTFGKSPDGETYGSLYHSYTARSFSPWLLWSSSEVKCGFVARPLPRTSVEARLSDSEEVTSRINWRGRSGGGELHLFHTKEVTNGFVRADVTQNRWHFEIGSDWHSRGMFLTGESLSAEWLGDYSLSGGLALRHLPDDRDWESEFFLSKGLSERVSSSGRAAYMLEKGVVSLLGGGLYYYGRHHLGCDLLVRRLEDRFNYYLSSYGNIHFRRALGLSILSELQFDEKWELVSAREVVGQIGGGVSPGIYHRYDRSFGHEVQGSVSFKF
jgi:hypothetical protein